MKTALIAAIGPNNELGYQGDLPWRIKEDLAYFKKVTANSNIIMGRHTWESLGEKPLPNRYNIIVSSKAKRQTSLFNIGNSVTCRSIDQALVHAQASQYEKTFFIGGAGIYKEALDIVDEIYLSIVEKVSDSIKADTFFPDFDISQYRKVAEGTYFTAEYIVTNLVLAKVKTNGERTDRSPGGLDNKSASGQPNQSRASSTIHWQGARDPAATIPRGY